ncbi:MAG: hypothetical protein ACRDFC_09795 [Ignavibacteria bacterium]
MFFFIISQACSKKPEIQKQDSANKNEFNWKEDLSMSDIPEFSVKGYMNGKEIHFLYVNFERWRGSNDNVINFSVVKPEQPCGYRENDVGFQLMNKGSEIGKGGWIKSGFDDDSKFFQSFYRYITSEGNAFKSDAKWNCALWIENISDKIVNGKIAVCFNDEKKSWIAGKFEAQICNN